MTANKQNNAFESISNFPEGGENFEMNAVLESWNCSKREMSEILFKFLLNFQMCGSTLSSFGPL